MTEAMDLAKTLDELVFDLGGRMSADVLNKAENTVSGVIDMLRTGKLVVVPDDAAERMARALATAIIDQDGPGYSLPVCWDGKFAYLDQGEVDFSIVATAALAALKGADHAG